MTTFGVLHLSLRLRDYPPALLPPWCSPPLFLPYLAVPSPCGTPTSDPATAQVSVSPAHTFIHRLLTLPSLLCLTSSPSLTQRWLKLMQSVSGRVVLTRLLSPCVAGRRACLWGKKPGLGFISFVSRDPLSESPALLSSVTWRRRPPWPLPTQWRTFWLTWAWICHSSLPEVIKCAVWA